MVSSRLMFKEMAFEKDSTKVATGLFSFLKDMFLGERD